ncbi:hypothetical protein GGX14DRAFT_359472, partial [Mycena pura]
GEAEHRRVKIFYAQTNKNRPNLQIARHERRQRLLNALATKVGQKRRLGHTVRKSMALDFAASEPLPRTDPSQHYQMSHSTKYSENLIKWIQICQNFVPKLKNHLLARILGGDAHAGGAIASGASEAHARTIAFVDDRIYKHKTIRFNYTTYDVRRKQDSCNPRTQANVMVGNGTGSRDDKDKYPYWDARLIGIFHVCILRLSFQTFDVLWVRWFGADDRQSKWGLKANRMPRIGFQNAENETSFGFLDPNAVLRACHVIPAFAFGYDNNGLLTSIGRPRQEVDDENEPDTDWAYYYVNMCVVFPANQLQANKVKVG